MKYVGELYLLPTRPKKITVHRGHRQGLFQTSVTAYVESNGDSSVPIRPVESELMTGGLARF